MFRLLVADDEPLIREGLKSILKRDTSAEYMLETAADGADAVEKMDGPNGFPDILITDIRMPNLDGIEVVRRLRERKASTRVIVLSGYNDFEYVRAMAVLGIENYLLKPVNEQELHDTLADVTAKMLREREQKAKTLLDENLIRENVVNRWLYGSIGENELNDRADFLDIDLDASWYRPCIMKLPGTAKDPTKQRLLKDDIFRVCLEQFLSEDHCYFARTYSGDPIAVFAGEENVDEICAAVINRCLAAVQRECHADLYVLLGERADGYWNVAASFKAALDGGRYLSRIEGDVMPAETEYSPLGRRMQDYVLAHYAEDLSLKTMAVSMKGNAAYLGQIFRRSTGKSFNEYLRDLRLAKAKELLAGDRFSAQEIALKVGFSNPTYFTSVFSKAFGVSPAEYRKQLG